MNELCDHVTIWEESIVEFEEKKKEEAKENNKVGRTHQNSGDVVSKRLTAGCGAAGH